MSAPKLWGIYGQPFVDLSPYLDVRALDFPDFMQQIVGMFELQARNKGLSFDYRSVGELPGVVRVDEKRLRQILINVLGNALKFTVRGGVGFQVEYRREMAVFEIRDSGPGIPDSDLERIFEPFERGSTAQAGGSGVGLTIARMLTDLLCELDRPPAPRDSRRVPRVARPAVRHAHL